MAKDDELKEVVKSLNKESEKEVSGFIRRIEQVLRDRVSDLDFELRDLSRGDLEFAARLGGLYESLERYGYIEELETLESIYAVEVQSIKRQFEITTREELITAVDLEVFESLIEFDIDQIDSNVRVHIDRLKSIIQREAIAGADLNILKTHEDLSKGTLRNIRTEINTGTAAFNRTVAARKAHEVFGDNPSYIYIGALDKITRDFCRDVLTDRNPPIYTEKEILAMDNDQGLDVLAFGGGYNCRHYWAPVSTEFKNSFR